MSRRTLKNASAAALMAAGLSLIASTPAQASPAACGVLIGESIFGSPACKIGDKIYSDFVKLQGSFTNAVWSFSNSEPEHTLNVSTFGTAFGIGTHRFSYKMAVVPEELGTRFFNSIRTGATTSGQGTNTYVKTLTSTPATVPSPISANQTQVSSVIGVYGPGVQAADFVSELVVTAGTVDQFTDSLVQNEPTNSVPGPLPILGAAAAFGFSRKLRTRIKQVA